MSTARNGRSGKKNAKRRARKRHAKDVGVDDKNEEREARSDDGSESDRQPVSAQRAWLSQGCYQPDAGGYVCMPPGMAMDFPQPYLAYVEDNEEPADKKHSSEMKIGKGFEKDQQKLKILQRKQRRIDKIKRLQARGIKLEKEQVNILKSEDDLLDEIHEIEERVHSKISLFDKPATSYAAAAAAPPAVASVPVLTAEEAESSDGPVQYVLAGMVLSSVPMMALYQNNSGVLMPRPYHTSSAPTMQADAENEHGTRPLPLPMPRKLSSKCALTLRDPETGEDLTQKVFGRSGIEESQPNGVTGEEETSIKVTQLQSPAQLSGEQNIDETAVCGFRESSKKGRGDGMRDSLHSVQANIDRSSEQCAKAHQSLEQHGCTSRLAPKSCSCPANLAVLDKGSCLHLTMESLQLTNAM